MDEQNLDSLLGQPTGNSGLLGSSLNGLFTLMMVASLVLTVAFVVLWVLGWLHKRKMENAIIEIRDTLREMNERDKARQVPPPRESRNDGRHIAVTEVDSSHEPI